MCSKKYNRAGQQGKSTDSCPEKENYTETIILMAVAVARGTVPYPVFEMLQVWYRTYS